MEPRNYSQTKCPHCEHTAFETVNDTPSHSNYKYTYLRCSKCKKFLGVFDFAPVGALLVKIADKVGVKVD